MPEVFEGSYQHCVDLTVGKCYVLHTNFQGVSSSIPIHLDGFVKDTMGTVIELIYTFIRNPGKLPIKTSQASIEIKGPMFQGIHPLESCPPGLISQAQLNAAKLEANKYLRNMTKSINAARANANRQLGLQLGQLGGRRRKSRRTRRRQKN